MAEPLKDIYAKHLSTDKTLPDAPEGIPEYDRDAEERIRDQHRAKAKLTASQRKIAAVKFRVMGYNFHQIAQAIGCSEQQARNYVAKAMAESQSKNVEELRGIQNEQLNYMLSKVWSQIDNGSLWAVDRGIKILERQAKLNGLDAPIQTAQVTINNNTTVTRSDQVDVVPPVEQLHKMPGKDAFLNNIKDLLAQAEAEKASPQA